MRTCEVDGCERDVRARGLCSTHYNQAHQPNRHAKVEVRCDWCGRACVKERSLKYAGRFCTLECRDEWRKTTGTAGRPKTRCHLAPDHPVRVLIAELKARRALEAQMARTDWPRCAVFIRPCSVCLILFTTRHTVHTCTDVCAEVKRLDDQREAKHRWRARKREAFRAPVVRREIYARDDWMCGLCGEPVDMTVMVPNPLAPTLDHILALANGGTHEPANVQTAHFRCNSLKGARTAA